MCGIMRLPGVRALESSYKGQPIANTKKFIWQEHVIGKHWNYQNNNGFVVAQGILWQTLQYSQPKLCRQGCTKHMVLAGTGSAMIPIHHWATITHKYRNHILWDVSAFCTQQAKSVRGNDWDPLG